MGAKYDALMTHLNDYLQLGYAQSVLGWDQQTMMPHAAQKARGEQQAVLGRIAHVHFTSDTTARLLDAADAEVSALPYDSNEASMIRIVRHDYDEATKIPAELVSEYNRLSAVSHSAWVEARKTDTFSTFEPLLTQMIDVCHRFADHLGYAEQPYDALLGRYERGMTTRQVQHIFDDHKPHLVALVKQILANEDSVSNALLHQEFDVAQQRKFGETVVKAFGFDFQRGRQDEAVHPFCSGTSRNDVRLTTRFDPKFLNPALFGTIHEAGHGMYEQGIGEALDGTMLGGGTSLAVHESQSRMWENMIARSRGFWEWALPLAQEYFPAQLGNASVDDVYRAVNKVQRSFIRVEADEATYNLHIMLRLELEVSLLNRSLKVSELPDAWDERFEAYLGIVPTKPSLGVLQDIHWSMGLVGYFATYALGNMLAAQYYNAAIKQHPTIPTEITQGKFDTLLTWLNRNIHQHGRKFNGDELTRQITGESIQSRDYIAYLTTKYGGIYGF
jgi:carboxypeptidase Taq